MLAPMGKPWGGRAAAGARRGKRSVRRLPANRRAQLRRRWDAGHAVIGADPSGLAPVCAPVWPAVGWATQQRCGPHRLARPGL